MKVHLEATLARAVSSQLNNDCRWYQTCNHVTSDMTINMCIDMYIDESIDMCIDMSLDEMSMDMSIVISVPTCLWT